MFEVGKQYKSKSTGTIMDCLWVSGDQAVLKRTNRPWMESVYATNKANFNGYTEYNEPKVEKLIKTLVEDHGDYHFTNAVNIYPHNRVAGKVYVTITDGKLTKVEIV